MALIKPFCCIRPRVDKAADIAALPYDVYSRMEAKAVVSENPDSFLKIDRAETLLGDSVDTYDEAVYQKAHDVLWELVGNGTFLKEETPCYYLYELTMDGRVQTGIVGCASIDDYTDNIIKKHENTRSEKEQDRIRHVDACNAQTGPIFLTYRANDVLKSLIKEAKKEEPLYDFVSEDKVRHRVFQVGRKEQMEQIREAFAQIRDIYIADGHHRAASAVKVGFMRRKADKNHTGREEYNYFLSVLFADEELCIMDYNRLVKDLNGFSHRQFFKRIEKNFEVTELAHGEKPKEKGSFSMYLRGKWYRLTVRQEHLSQDTVEGLDVSLLQNLLLDPILDIRDPKTSDRIDFVGGIRGLKELERRVDEGCAAAFAMYPTSIQELFEVADEGRLMPPKSTWFEPKLRSGLFIHEI